MPKVKILICGKALREGEERVTSTTVLVKANNFNLIVDPGMNRNLLLESLKKENLKPSDIDYVFLSHYHMDHSLLTGIFENSQVLYTEDIYSFNGKISEREGNLLGEEIKIVKTPGHNSDCRTMLVKTGQGVIAIAEDVFWWWDDEEQKTDFNSLMEHKDEFATDNEKLRESRKLVLEKADYIIPGHGKMFKVKK
jgi:glyoxylase-like metal-dependent hydrolase (beta-lactamase superfamily II)